MQPQQSSTPVNMTALADGILAKRAVEGDQIAFEVLVRRYSTPLFNFICHFLGDYDQACDVLQQVFMRFFVSLPKLETDDPFKPWLFQVARNCCIDDLRRRRRHAIHFSQLEVEDDENTTSLLNDIPDTCPLPEEIAEHHDLRELLNRTIQELPPKFRSVVLLRYAAQLSFAEIGRTLNMPEATAKTYFHRAKALLRKLLTTQVQGVSLL